MARKLKRNDVVLPASGGLITLYGRVWRRLDCDHVVVLDCGSNVKVYRDDELERSDYRGTLRSRPSYSSTPRRPLWDPMTPLKRLKLLASVYSPLFGGRRLTGRRWTRQEKNQAWANIIAHPKNPVGTVPP